MQHLKQSMSEGLINLKTWVLWVIVAGVVLDLVISGVLIGLTANQLEINNRISSTVAVSQCWDHLLDEAVKAGPKATPSQRQILVTEAQACARMDKGS